MMDELKVLVVSDQTDHSQYVGKKISSALKMRFADVVHVCLPAVPLSFRPDVALLLCDVSDTELGSFLEDTPCVSMSEDYEEDVYIPGREIFVGVLGFPVLRALPPLELPPFDKSEPTMWTPWSDPKIGPALLDTATSVEVTLVAVDAHFNKGCKDGYSYTELRLSDSGAITVVRTVMNPFIAPHYIMGIAARAGGLPFEDLCRLIVRQAAARTLTLGGNNGTGKSSG